MSKKLDESQIQDALLTVPSWMLDQGELAKTATFDDFKQAMKFVNHVADLAEEKGHHPDIDIRYNKVRLSLVTHDSGGLTKSDFDLAREIDKKR